MTGRPGISLTLNAEQRRQRARKAALARTTVDAHIKALVDKAPPLSEEQQRRLAELLRPSDSTDCHGDVASGGDAA
jgi:hypothetical protein